VNVRREYNPRVVLWSASAFVPPTASIRLAIQSLILTRVAGASPQKKLANVICADDTRIAHFAVECRSPRRSAPTKAPCLRKRAKKKELGGGRKKHGEGHRGIGGRARSWRLRHHYARDHRPGSNPFGAEWRPREGVDGTKLHHALHDFGGTKRRIHRPFCKARICPARRSGPNSSLWRGRGGIRRKRSRWRSCRDGDGRLNRGHPGSCPQSRERHAEAGRGESEIQASARNAEQGGQNELKQSGTGIRAPAAVSAGHIHEEALSS